MPTTTEFHRHACEVRFAAAMTTEARRKYFELVLAKRGQGAANALIAAVNAYRRQQMANSSQS